MAAPYGKGKRKRERAREAQEPNYAGTPMGIPRKTDDEEVDDVPHEELPGLDDAVEYFEDDEMETPADKARRMTEDDDGSDDDESPEFDLPFGLQRGEPKDDDEEEPDEEVLEADDAKSRPPKRQVNDSNLVSYKCVPEADKDIVIEIWKRRSPRELQREIWNRCNGEYPGVWKITVCRGKMGTISDIYHMEVHGSEVEFEEDEDDGDDENGFPFALDKDDEMRNDTHSIANLQPIIQRAESGDSAAMIEMFKLLLEQQSQLQRDLLEQRRDRGGNGSLREYVEMLTPIGVAALGSLKEVFSSQAEGIKLGIEMAKSASSPKMIEIITAAAMPILAGISQNAMQMNMGQHHPQFPPPPPEQALPNQPAEMPAPPPPEKPPFKPANTIEGQFQAMADVFFGGDRRLTDTVYWATKLMYELSESECDRLLAMDRSERLAKFASASQNVDLPDAIRGQVPQWMDLTINLMRQATKAQEAANNATEVPAENSNADERSESPVPAPTS